MSTSGSSLEEHDDEVDEQVDDAYARLFDWRPLGKRLWAEEPFVFVLEVGLNGIQLSVLLSRFGWLW